MPIVTIQVTREGTSPGAERTTQAQKDALYRGVSDLLLHVLGKQPDDTFVVFQEVELGDWGRGGLSTPAYRAIRGGPHLSHREKTTTEMGASTAGSAPSASPLRPRSPR